jgi:hypothetical protein
MSTIAMATRPPSRNRPFVADFVITALELSCLRSVMHSAFMNANRVGSYGTNRQRVLRVENGPVGGTPAVEAEGTAT